MAEFADANVEEAMARIDRMEEEAGAAQTGWATAFALIEEAMLGILGSDRELA